MTVWELETKNGRVFRVALENSNQAKRLTKIIQDNKNKEYEVFTRIEELKNGISSISQFEKLATTLV